MRKIVVDNSNIFWGNLILVNSEHPFKKIEEVTKHYLVPINCDHKDIYLNRTANEQLGKILCDIDCGEQIVPVSGFRDEYEQKDIYSECLCNEGVGYTTDFVAIPGHSEHHTGLAIDLGLKKNNIDFICPDFPYTGICQKFRENAAKYGFIERYQEGCENITKVAKEPWHFRYVGSPHAEIIEKLNITLEEYIDLLKKYTQDNYFEYKSDNRKYKIFNIRPESDTEHISIELENECYCSISGDNDDSIVVTTWTNC